jgi:hypothetical protein
MLIPFTDHPIFDIPSTDLSKMGIAASFFKQFLLPPRTNVHREKLA